MRFECERDNLPIQSNSDEELLTKLAMEYHNRCEAFDRSICSDVLDNSARPRGRGEEAWVKLNSRETLDAIIIREHGRNDPDARRILREYIHHTRDQFLQGIRNGNIPEFYEPFPEAVGKERYVARRIDGRDEEENEDYWIQGS